MLDPAEIGNDCAGIIERGKLALLVNLLHPAGDSVHDAAPQRNMIAVKPEAHEIQRLRIKFADLPISFQLQTVFGELIGNLPSDAVKFPFVPSENDHVIHVTQIMHRMKLLLDVMVNVRNKEIGEYL